MKDHATYETSVLLKEAGFPQPTPEAGQFWWGKKAAGDSEKGSICVLIGTERGALNFRPVNGVENENNKFFVFAPTAQDILKVLFPVDIRGQIGAMDILRLALDVERAATAYLAAAQAFLNLEAKP